MILLCGSIQYLTRPVSRLSRRHITLASEWIQPRSTTTTNPTTPEESASTQPKDIFVFLHGLLGNRRNILTLAKTLCSKVGRRGLLMDIRGHGESQLTVDSGTKTPTTLEDCAQDVYETLLPYADDLQAVNWTLVGHSLGGRVSMLYALQQKRQQQQGDSPSSLMPQNIWLLDTVPGALDASVRHVIDVACQLENGSLLIPKTRSALVDTLVQDHGMTVGVAQWLASSFNLKQQSFNFDLKVAQEIVHDFDASSFMDWIKAEPVPVDLVRGGANTSWQKAAGHWEELQDWHEQAEREFRIHTLPNAGHWLHMDDLNGLVDIISTVQEDLDQRTSRGGRGGAVVRRPGEVKTLRSPSLNAPKRTLYTSCSRSLSSSSKTSVLDRSPMRPYPQTPRREVPSSIPHPPYARTGLVPPLQNPDGVYVHDATSINRMRAAAQLARRTLDLACQVAKPGVTTDEVDAIVHEAIIAAGAYPSPLNYAGFPKSLCSSVNEVICHGIPDKRPLCKGDVVSFDVSCFLNGVHGDNCGTIIVGDDPASPDEASLSDAERLYWNQARHLVKTAQEALDAAIETVRPGSCLTEVGAAIENVADREGLQSVRKYRGHGIAHEFHCPPFVKHYRNYDRLTLREGMIFTIEPMLVIGKQDCLEWDDEWTVVTQDKSLAAQFEHTVLVTDTGVEVLTLNPDSTDKS